MRALQQNTLRAGLTILGIVIGIAAVIAMVEIGNGSADSIKATIAGMGANSITVQPGAAASGGVSFGLGSAVTLTVEDFEAIQRSSPSIANVAPIVRARSQVIYQNKNWVPQYVYGTTPEFLSVRDWEGMAEGAMFADRDVRNGNKVCVIGQTIRRELFGDVSPLGKEIRVQNVSLKVIGVLRPKGANMMGFDQDDLVIAPWTTVKYRISGNSASQTTSQASASSAPTTGSEMYPVTTVQLYPPASESQERNSPVHRRLENVDQILVKARRQEEMAPVMQQITALLRERHRLRADEPDDFNIRDMTEVTRAFSSTTQVMTNLLLCVSLISLVVGGVGIMNIMLVSVTERTREIGLRLAVGARERDIRQQFLVEAVVLCVIGGIIGVLLGRFASWMVASLLQWPTRASLGAVIAAVCVSGGVGIVFGYYPARRASKLNPIEALRYE